RTAGQGLARNNTTAILQPTFPPGNTTFTAEVFSNTKVSLFTGSVTQLVTSDLLSLPLPLTATKPVLVVVPDTAKTTTLTSAPFSIYNAGVGSLTWNLGTNDTAFTRCGAACTILPASGSVAPGATTVLRATIPANFPSRTFAFVLQSPQGSVTIRWQYGASAITGVTMQPT